MAAEPSTQRSVNAPEFSIKRSPFLYFLSVFGNENVTVFLVIWKPGWFY